METMQILEMYVFNEVWAGRPVKITDTTVMTWVKLSWGSFSRGPGL